MDSKQIGNLTELQCITRFYELGFTVSVPYGDSEKYDFILDVNGNLYRLQVKHANLHFNSNRQIDFITLDTTWQSGYTKGKNWKYHKYTENEIDYFVTHYDGKNYLIPVAECSTMKTLRILKPKNNQKQNIHYLKDYIDEEVLRKLVC